MVLNKIKLPVLKLIFIFLLLIALISFISCKEEPVVVEEEHEEEKPAVEVPGETEEETKEEAPVAVMPEEEITIESDEYEEIDKLSSVLQKASKAIVSITWKGEAEDISGNSYSAEVINTGIVYSKDGYIITSFTTLGKIGKITVTIPDGTEFSGDLVGMDKNTTISVIKIDAQNLESLDFITTEDVNVGEAVISISKNPTGEMNFSQGFVTAVGQYMNMPKDALPFLDLIKTDIEVEHGFAGGFLVNMDGEVIGINAVMIQSGDGNKFLSLAIPSSIATNIADQIIEYGSAKIPYIGIEMGQNDTDISGVLVGGLAEDSPASKSGVEVGDIIVEFDGVELKDSYQLIGQILRKNVGDSVQLKIYRDGDYVTLNINLGEKPV